MPLLLILVLLLCFGGVGLAPGWGYHQMGWGPSGGLGLALIVVLVFLLLGRA